MSSQADLGSDGRRQQKLWYHIHTKRIPHSESRCPDLSLHQCLPLVRIALLGFSTLHAKIRFSMGKVTLEFCTICNKVFYLEETKAYMSLHHEF